MKEEDTSPIVQIFLALRVQHVLASLKLWLDLLWLASRAMKAQDPLSDHQLPPLHLLSALNVFHNPEVSWARNRSSR